MANLTLVSFDQALQPRQKLVIPASLYQPFHIILTEFIHQLQIGLRKRPSRMRELLSLYQEILKAKETIEQEVRKTPSPVSENQENPKEEELKPATELADEWESIPEALKQLTSNLQAWALLQSEVSSKKVARF